VKSPPENKKSPLEEDLFCGYILQNISFADLKQYQTSKRTYHTPRPNKRDEKRKHGKNKDENLHNYDSPI
jgi:hypothetical protein